MNDNHVIHNEALVIHLTVGQIKTIIESVIQEASLLSRNVQSEILSIEEVSEITGYKKATIYKLIHERKIPFHKPAHGGRKVFFKKVEIDQWLQFNSIGIYGEFSDARYEKFKRKNKHENTKKY